MLKPVEGAEHDYINANFIEVSLSIKYSIIFQTPNMRVSETSPFLNS